MLRQPLLQQQQQWKQPRRKHDPAMMILRRWSAIGENPKSRRTASSSLRWVANLPHGRVRVVGASMIFVMSTMLLVGANMLAGMDRPGLGASVRNGSNHHHHTAVRPDTAGSYRNDTMLWGGPRSSTGSDHPVGLASSGDAIDGDAVMTTADHRPRSDASTVVNTMKTSFGGSSGGGGLVGHTDHHSPVTKNHVLDDVLFLHVGKAGGGTVMERLTKFGLVNVTRCHPRPCPGLLSSKNGNQTRPSSPPSTTDNSTVGKGGRVGRNRLRNRSLRTVLVNVRDPVDRFYSAFHWRDLVFCRPGDERTVVGGVGGGGGTADLRHEAVDRPDEYCQRITLVEMAELGMIRRKYGSDANALAEALCGRYEGDVEGAAEARRDLKSLTHAKDSLADWLGFAVEASSSNGGNDDNNGTEEGAVWLPNRGMELIAVVQEPEYDFIAQVDAAVRWMVDGNSPSATTTSAGDVTIDSFVARPVATEDDTLDRTTANTAYRHSYRKYLPKGGPGNEGDASAKGAATWEAIAERSLSRLGDCCVARHYAMDYRLIRDVLLASRDAGGGDNRIVEEESRRGACRGKGAGECRAALRSILSRRADVLGMDLDGNGIVDGGDGDGDFGGSSCRDLYATPDHG